MREYTLPSHSKYKKLLHSYAKLLRIKIVTKSLDTDGEYSRASRTIFVDSDCEEAYEISVILHELGHALDDLIFSKYKTRENSAYHNVYLGKGTKNQDRIVLECEKSAWVNARRLGQQLGIKLGKWFDEHERVCLNDYRRSRAKKSRN